MLATRIAAQAVSKSKSATRVLDLDPERLREPPKYSPTIAPIIARTVATFKAAKMYGSAVGIRRRRKIWSSPAA